MMLNSVNIDGEIYSLKSFEDKNGKPYYIMRLKIINTNKNRITDVSLIDCFLYNENYKKCIKEFEKNDKVRITGKLQKVNTKNHTIKVFKIKKLKEIN